MLLKLWKFFKKKKAFFSMLWCFNVDCFVGLLLTSASIHKMSWVWFQVRAVLLGFFIRNFSVAIAESGCVTAWWQWVCPLLWLRCLKHYSFSEIWMYYKIHLGLTPGRGSQAWCYVCMFTNVKMCIGKAISVVVLNLSKQFTCCYWFVTTAVLRMVKPNIIGKPTCPRTDNLWM